MSKWYITSGSIKSIITSDHPLDAAAEALSKAKEGTFVENFIYVDQRGHRPLSCEPWADEDGICHPTEKSSDDLVTKIGEQNYLAPQFAYSTETVFERMGWNAKRDKDL